MITLPTSSRLKFYEDNTNPMPIELAKPSAVGNWGADGTFRPINKKLTTESRAPNQPTGTLDRYLAPILYKTEIDIDTSLRYPEDCNRPRDHYDMDKIHGIDNDKYSLIGDPISQGTNEGHISDMRKDNVFLINDPDFKALADKYNINCSERRKNLDWSDYRAPPKQTSQGFGNPENYQDIHLGLDSRIKTSTGYEDPREVDLGDRTMIPVDAAMINYKGIKYEDNARAGIQTRNYKKVDTSFNNFRY